MNREPAELGITRAGTRRRGAARPLRIWNIPCASGEEPLTIAMLLRERGWFERLPIELHASDASPSAIARAKDGAYRDRSFRSLAPEMREKYFVACPCGSRPVQSLRDRVNSWSVVNLLSTEPSMRLVSSPAIFCRNAFIYFSPAAIRKTIDTFAEVMPTPGYLCVGASESL